MYGSAGYRYDGALNLKHTNSMAFFPIDLAINLEPGYRKAIEVDGVQLLLIQPDERPLLIKNQCPHMDVRLDNADIESDLLRCKAHGIEFSLSDGKAQGPLRDVLTCLKFFPISFDDRFIGVDTDDL